MNAPRSVSAEPLTPPLDTRVPALDGIRGIAILLVMLHHFAYYGGMRPTAIVDKLFYTITYVGWCGVDLFFVLSGFLITGILFDTKGGHCFFRNFYMRRLLRIFPLYYGFLVVFFLILPRIVPVGAAFHSLGESQGWYWSYLVNLQIARDGWPSFPAIGHFWSLAVEEQFYLFWPVVVFLLPRRALMITCLVFIVGSFGTRVGLAFAGYSIAAYVLTPARMDALAVGAFLALLTRGPNGFASLSRWAWPVAGTAVGVLSAMIIWRQGFYPADIVVQTIGHTLLAILFGAVLGIAATSPHETALGKVFAHRGLIFFGHYSYALYVFHPLIIFFITRKWFTVGSVPPFMGSQLPGQILFSLVATGASLVLALLSWHMYEAQFLKLKNMFRYQKITAAVSDEYKVNYVPTS